MNLLTNGRVITRDEGGKGYYEKGAVAYEGTKIDEVGEEAALQASGKSIQDLAAEEDAAAEFEIAELFDDLGSAAGDDE